MSEVPAETVGDDTGSSATLSPRSFHELALLLSTIAHDMGEAPAEARRLLERIETSTDTVGQLRSLGRARKVSVSMPEGLTAAVQRRVGKGEFSHYVAEAVARQLEMDLLAELASLLEAEHGPVPERFLAEAAAAWPDHE